MGLQGRFDEALALLNELPNDEDEDAELRARILLERGRVLNSSGDPDGALPCFGLAWANATTAKLEFLAIDAVHMEAIVTPLDRRNGFNAIALDMAERAHDPRARHWRASLLNNMGWTLFELGHPDRALPNFEQALVARREQGKAADIVVARWCIARMLRELGRVDEALTIQLQLADELGAAGKNDPYVDEEIATCRAALDEDDAASG